MTLPGHPLFDTGAQRGTVGLSHWHRWCICLATCYGVQPRILNQPLGHASGVGGDSKVLARCQMPTGIAGINGITTWLVLEETQENQIPALFPIDIMGDMDMVHEICDKRVNIRSYTTKEGKALTTQLEELPTKHQTIDLCAFGPSGFSIDFDQHPGCGVREDYLYTGKPPKPHLGADWRLDVSAVVVSKGNYITQDEYDGMMDKREADALKQVPQRRITSDSFVCDLLAGTSGGPVEQSVPPRSPTGSDACQVLPCEAPHNATVTMDVPPRFAFSPSAEIWFDSHTNLPVPRYLMHLVEAQNNTTAVSATTAVSPDAANLSGDHVFSPSVSHSIGVSKETRLRCTKDVWERHPGC